MAASIPLLLGAGAPGTVDVQLDGLRSARGDVLICMTAEPASFPRCQNDPAARRLVVAARDAQHLRFTGVPSGVYAVALVHDENGNRQLDTLARIPREGVGFSRNPKLGFGPPRFEAARFGVASGEIVERVRVKYFL